MLSLATLNFYLPAKLIVNRAVPGRTNAPRLRVIHTEREGIDPKLGDPMAIFFVIVSPIFRMVHVRDKMPGVPCRKQA